MKKHKNFKKDFQKELKNINTNILDKLLKENKNNCKSKKTHCNCDCKESCKNSKTKNIETLDLDIIKDINVENSFTVDDLANTNVKSVATKILSIIFDVISDVADGEPYIDFVFEEDFDEELELLNYNMDKIEKVLDICYAYLNDKGFDVEGTLTSQEYENEYGDDADIRFDSAHLLVKW